MKYTYCRSQRNESSHDSIVTLRDLKDILPSTNKKALPTVKQLREHDCLLMFQPLYDGDLRVFSSGFAVYRAGKHTTVIRVDRVSSLTYEFSTADKTVSLDDLPWATALTLAAEKRMEDFQADRCSRICVGFAVDCDVEDSENRKPSDSVAIAGPDNVEASVVDKFDDRMEQILGCLTPRQRQVVEMYFCQGLTQQAVADELGVTHQAVGKLLKAAVNNIKKNQKKFS